MGERRKLHPADGRVVRASPKKKPPLGVALKLLAERRDLEPPSPGVNRSSERLAALDITNLGSAGRVTERRVPLDTRWTTTLGSKDTVATGDFRASTLPTSRRSCTEVIRSRSRQIQRKTGDAMSKHAFSSWSNESGSIATAHALPPNRCRTDTQTSPAPNQCWNADRWPKRRWLSPATSN